MSVADVLRGPSLDGWITKDVPASVGSLAESLWCPVDIVSLIFHKVIKRFFFSEMKC